MVVGETHHFRVHPHIFQSLIFRGHVVVRFWVCFFWRYFLDGSLLIFGNWDSGWNAAKDLVKSLKRETKYNQGTENFTGWWFQIFFGIFIPKIGEMIPNLTSIFFRWVVQPPSSLHVLLNKDLPSQRSHHFPCGQIPGVSCLFYPSRPMSFRGSPL